MGGVWSYALELMKGLQKYNVEFLLAVLDKPLNKFQIEDIRELKNVSVAENSFKLEWMENAWKDVDLSGEWLLNLKDKFAPDLVHLNGYSHGALHWDIPVLITGHSCVLSWYNEVKRNSPPEIWDEYKTRARKGLLNADMIITPSDTMLNYLQRYYGKLDKAKVIYNGIDPAGYKPGDKKNKVFSLGRLWDEGKNIYSIIQSVPFIKWPVYFAGDDKDPFGINYFDNVNSNFLGIISRKKVSYHLSEASIFAHPAKYEPFGLAPLEAAYSGCALVLGNIESLKEIWEDNALYVDPFDNNDISSTINRLIDDKRMRGIYALRAFEHAQRYNINAMSIEYYLTYKEMISNYLINKKEVITGK